MTTELLGTEISQDERVARFVTSKHWIRSSNNTVKPDAFIPPPDGQLSVTRHTGLSEKALWEIGQKVVAEVGEKRSAALFGRADLVVESVMSPLKVEAAPLPTNANHAHIIGWPNDKPAQKSLAQRLAAIAEYTAFKKEW